MIIYSGDKKQAIYKGVTFTRDDITGYYLNSTLRIRLHRFVWKTTNGEIPEGYVIHHKDSDKSNNDISNLMLMVGVQHAKQHGIELTSEQRERLRTNLLEKAQPKAIEWHKSREGRKFHKEHYEKFKGILQVKEVKVCEQCQSPYNGHEGKNERFCSNKCKSAWRRKSGLDDEIRVCGYCGKEYKINKYKKTTVCSKSCSMLLYPRHHGLNSKKVNK